MAAERERERERWWWWRQVIVDATKTAMLQHFYNFQLSIFIFFLSARKERRRRPPLRHLFILSKIRHISQVVVVVMLRSGPLQWPLEEQISAALTIYQVWIYHFSNRQVSLFVFLDISCYILFFWKRAAFHLYHQFDVPNSRTMDHLHARHLRLCARLHTASRWVFSF